MNDAFPFPPIWERFIHETIACRLDEDRLPSPVISVIGPRRCGKSRLLDEIAGRCRDSPKSELTRPLALLSLRSGDYLRPYEVALLIADKFGRPTVENSGIRFPRLVLGSVVLRLVADADRPLEKAEIRSKLNGDGPLVAQLRELIRELVDDADFGAAEKILFGLATKGVFAAVRTVRRWRESAYAWYRNETGQRDIWDALRDLQAAEIEHRRPDHDGKQSGDIDHLLCRAFLTDIAAAYGGRVGPWVRNGSALALVDDADCESGRDFIAFVVTARNAMRSTDPLVLVTTSNHLLTDTAIERRFAQKDYSDWDAACLNSDGPGGAVHVVSAPRLTPDEADRFAMIAGYFPLKADGADIAAAVSCAYELSAGHIWAFELLICAIAARWSQLEPTATRPSLREIFDWNQDSDGKKIGDVVVDCLLADEGASLADALVTCSAARDFSANSAWNALYLDDDDVVRQLDSFREASSLVVRTESRYTLDPLLRRPLLWRLAQRPTGSEVGWKKVNARLKRATDDLAEQRFYSLPLGELVEVANMLDETHDGQSAGWWLDVSALIDAPIAEIERRNVRRSIFGGHRRSSESGQHAAGRRARVAADAIGGLWLRSDPMGDPHDELSAVVEDRIRELAKSSTDGYILSNVADSERDRRQAVSRRRTGWHNRWAEHAISLARSEQDGGAS